MNESVIELRRQHDGSKMKIKRGADIVKVVSSKEYPTSSGIVITLSGTYNSVVQK